MRTRILLKHTDVFDAPRNPRIYFEQLRRCGGDIPLNIFATVNAFFSAGDPGFEAQPSLEAELLSDSIKNRVKHFRKRIIGKDDSLIFTRAAGLLNLKALLSVRRDKCRLTAVGAVALHANDYLDISLAQPDAEILAVQNLPVWEIYHPREVWSLLARYYLVTQELFAGDERIVQLFHDEFGTRPETTAIDGLLFDDYFALFFGIYSRVVAGARNSKTSIVEFAEHAQLLGLQDQQIAEFTASRIFDEDAFMAKFGEIDSAERFVDRIGDPSWALDFNAFRERPLLRLRDGREIVIDLHFLIENASVGVFWNVLRRMSDTGRKLFLSYWGNIFEKYVNLQLERHTPADGVLSFGCIVDECEVDAVLMLGRIAVVFESKAGMLPNAAKCSRDVITVRKAIERKFVSNTRGKQKGVRQLARSCSAISSGQSEFGEVDQVFPILVVDEPSFQTPGINTCLAGRFAELADRQDKIEPLAVFTIDEMETILPHVAAGDLSWSELLCARNIEGTVAVSPVIATFSEIADLREFRQRPNAILAVAAKRLAEMIREKYKHLQ